MHSSDQKQSIKDNQNCNITPSNNAFNLSNTNNLKDFQTKNSNYFTKGSVNSLSNTKAFKQ